MQGRLYGSNKNNKKVNQNSGREKKFRKKIFFFENQTCPYDSNMSVLIWISYSMAEDDLDSAYI